MVYKLEYTRSFEEDLDSTLDYLKNILYNSAAASKLYNDIKKTFELVCVQPEMFPLHKLKRIRDRGYRYFTIGNYLIFYSVDHEKHIIFAHTIIYGARELNNIF
ncbi:MAG: type II toxin-antitoxin system RelE/ParE family toxin [Oscillospiraceae bacterium]|nr:type II toxin-antitoxin system RelE/ParE family toxin [Oscillospiraceae bacterium]